MTLHRAILAAMLLAISACAPAPPAAPGVVSGRAPEAPADRPVVSTTEPWTFQDQPGRIVTTDNYRIFTTDTDPIISARLPAFLEAALVQYTTALGPLPLPAERLDVFLMAKRWQWTRLTQQLMGEQADIYLRIPRGGYAAGGRAILYNIGVRDTLAIAAHEGWHQYTQRVFRDSLPVYLEEGLATYMEGYRPDPRRPGRPVFLGWANTERFDQLRSAAARGDLMPLDALLAAAPQNLIQDTQGGTLTYYAQVWALIHFFNEGQDGRYRAAFHALVLDAAEGRLRRRLEERIGPRAARHAIMSRRGPGVVFAYFTADLPRLGEQYARFIDRLVRTGSKDLIVQGRSPMGP